MTSEISMASMSDIAFLLIIFFMVSSAFIMKDGLHLTLPDKNKKPVVVSPKDVVTIILSKNGRITYNEKNIEKPDLEKKLVEDRKKMESLFVLLKIHKSITYEKAIDLIDSVKFAGIKKLSIKMIE